MKSLIIAALLSTTILGAQAEVKTPHGSFENYEHKSDRENKAMTLEEQVDLQLFNLGLLKKQYKIAQETVKRSKGNHQEIESDFNFFHSILVENLKRTTDKQDIQRAILRLKREYARKHRNRANYELAKQKRLAALMQRELDNYQRVLRTLQSKYKKQLAKEHDAVLQQFEQQLAGVERRLKEDKDSMVQDIAFYQQQMQLAKL